jgi:hypothetical protein
MNNSILLSAKTSILDVNFGQNYRENAIWTSLEKEENGMTSLLSRTDADRIGRNNFIKSAVTFDVGKTLLLN